MGVIADLLKNERDLPTREMLKRMNQRIVKGEDEGVLIINALHALEHVEGRQRFDALELETRNRRELKHYFDAVIKQAGEERDALRIEDLIELREVLLNPPETTHTRWQETVDQVIKAMMIKKQHPYWTYERIVTEMNLQAADTSGKQKKMYTVAMIKKAVQRVKKAAKSVP